MGLQHSLAMPSKQLSVIVVGAGIGGLTTAIALRRAGHKVTIYEKSSLSHEIGQGITISPHGGRILQRLGMDFQKARMTDYMGTNIVDAATLEPKAPMLDQSGWGRQFGVRMKTAYRIDLHANLLELARSDKGEGPPVKVLARAGVLEIDADNASITLENGETIKADILIAADGVRSKAAKHIVGNDCPEVQSSGTIVYRFTLPTERLLNDPETAHLLSAGAGITTFNVSPKGDRWLVRYYCRGTELQNFAMYTLRTHEDADRQEHDLRFKTDRASLRREMEGFHPSLLKVASMASDVLPLWRCTTREPLPRMSRGRMAVIGDAAHPVMPHIGLGAVSAIEDAAALGALFTNIPASATDTDTDTATLVQHRLALFSRLRAPRVAVYKLYSDCPFFIHAVQAQRHAAERYMAPRDLPQTQAELRPWYMGYDVYEDVKRALGEELLAA
ncbi:hypothetical protein LTR36_001858 [Oleoguttula mirabilis]|uniref:FAD-binding domain-containing protein n=1 Tax=Oleoguttula mirabilis TaxID=1507867 RepID=A0AAV9JMT7_9PEZI|nr:hypothetical protein LTR36_001858 [Oleoguttula mirabilis]